MGAYKTFLIPIAAILIAMIFQVGVTVGYVQYSINRNNTNIIVAEQEAIQKNNQKWCNVLVLVNQSAKGASNANLKPNSYTLRLRKDFEMLDREYKCGS
jgi:hypothetical protein